MQSLRLRETNEVKKTQNQIILCDVLETGKLLSGASQKLPICPQAVCRGQETDICSLKTQRG